jgi:membrane protease subunit HflC
MQAYERSMQHNDTHLVLRPDNDFFRYFGDPTGKTPPEAAAAPAAPTAGTATSGTASSPGSPPRAQR